MKDIVLIIFVFLASLHQSACVVFAATESPVSQPADSPVSASMAAFSPGIQAEGSEVRKMVTHKRLLIALIAACASFSAILFFSMFFWAHHRKHLTDSKQKNPKRLDCESGRVLLPLLRRFSSARSFARTSTRMSNKKSFVTFIDYKTLEKGTGCFKETNILGKGGYGCVYKTKLDNNTLAAVKKLDCSTEEAVRECENEVDLLSKIQHPNIISILGCSTNDNTRFIVYELMHNGSLETQLHGPSHGSALTWHMRMKIALDTARGLEYLHEHCNPSVIHRDLKSSNILLDSNFNAKISDFGLAVVDGVKNKNIKLSGTLGYVAPEYLLDGQLTDKSDVFAYGVVLLELLLGRRPVEKLASTECQSIVTWAMPHLTDRSKLLNIIDPVIKDTMDLRHLYQVAAVAVLCVQPEPSYRPLITDVLHSLIPLVPMELGGTLRLTKNETKKAAFLISNLPLHTEELVL